MHAPHPLLSLPCFSIVVCAGRTLALAAKAQAAAQQVFELDDTTAFDLARKSL